MMTIGEFSRICFVTKKTLRHYDEIGLLRPEAVGDNGYRYYTAAQLRTMRLIARLKAYGLSLDEVAAVLDDPDEERLALRLDARRRRMEAGMEETRRVLEQMRRDIEKLKRGEDIMEYHIQVKTIERKPLLVYGIRQEMNVKEFGARMTRLFQEVAEKQMQPVGPPLAFYHEEEFNDEHSDIELAVPVKGEADGTRVVPGGLHAVTTLTGPYEPEGFTAAYAGIVRWIEENGYRMSGPPFDKYVSGGDGVDPKDFVTEIYFPITK